jgi:hypothetical protein
MICPDLVLVIERRFVPAVKAFSSSQLPQNQSLSWADSSGNRSVFLYIVNGEQQDLPFEVFEHLQNFLSRRFTNINLIMIREDPGPGIHLPELDETLPKLLK